MNKTNMSLDSNAVGEHDDIMYPSALPFVLVHLSCIAAIWSGVTWQAIAICAGLYWLRMFSSFLRCLLRVPPRRASCGGRQNTDTTIYIPIPSKTSIHPVTRAFSIVMWDGYLPRSTTRPTS